VKEITFELTNYCPYDCKFCSSDITNNRRKAIYLDPLKLYTKLEEVTNHMKDKLEHIILSGGEPMSHPDFYNILETCKLYSDDVVVYSNAITHLIYNSHVIDGVYLEANMTLSPEVDRLHVLRRVKQGKEANRPEIKLSRNFHEDCSCDHRIMRPDGSVCRAPCDKWNKIEGE